MPTLRKRSCRDLRRLLVSGVASLAWLVVPTAHGQSAEPTAADDAPAAVVLKLETIRVTPEKPGVDTLCQLFVTVHNGGPKAVSGLQFAIEINGLDLAVYASQVFLDVLPPGASTEVKLYNFWTTETGRDAPKNGALEIDVSLTEARWIDIQTAEDGAETWTLLENLARLPDTSRHTVKLTAPTKQAPKTP